jgi:iron complex outermembrane receptor protein
MPGSAMRGYGSALVAAVDPETQSGIEWGADLRWDAPRGARVAMQATRFDQLASNLAQPVAVLRDSSCYLPRPGPALRGPGEGRPCRHEEYGVGYELQNVGEIANDGWELQASVARGALTIASSLALVDSRVQRVRAAYGGDLRVGDRMLEVPARTVGVSASWTSERWTLATTVARASNWINYDRLGLAEAFATTDSTTPPPVGAAQREWWLRYDGVTRVGARLDVMLWRATALTLRGDNLLDRQTGEPDNVTVLPGRTLMVGVRTGF